MANFNYLDFFKTPSATDNKLFIKDINNEIKWTISTFKISSYFVQNNNIRINFKNGDFAVIDFNNVYESKIAITKLKTAIAALNEVTPFAIDKDVELYVENLIGTNSSSSSNFSATSSTPLQIPEIGDYINLTIPTNMSWIPMQSVIAYANLYNNYMDDDYVVNDSSAYFIGNVDSYDRISGTLSLIIDKSEGYGLTDSNNQTATYSLWYVNITGKSGALNIETPGVNRLITSTSDVDSVKGHSNLTFDGQLLKIAATTELQQTIEVLNTSTASTIITYDYNLGSIWYHNNLIGNFVAYFKNIPLISNRVITTSIIIEQGSTPYIPMSIAINDIFYSINWASGETPIGNTNSIDIIGLSFVYTDSFKVIGQISNYDSVSSSAATLTTGTPVNTSNTYFESICFITSDGGTEIIQKGVVYGTSSLPSLLNSYTNNGNGSDVFTASVSGLSFGLSDGQLYYYRAYAINNYGISYGNQETFTTYLCLAKGTKISVLNSEKNIEDINYEDDIIVWNFDEGKFDISKALWIKKEQISNKYNLLEFNDGTYLKTIDQHRIFNKQKGKFTYPMSEETPIGTITFNKNGEEIVLISKEVINESVEYYNIITNKHINIFANGILTSCRYNNIYEIIDMKFIKDARILRNTDEFINIPLEYIEGLRLREQLFNIEEISSYINRLELNKK